jgi:hypothetical protein
MNNLVLPRTNGSAPHSHPVQMRQTVQQFFGGFNWENNPPEIQKLMQQSPNSNDRPISLTLKVSQFLATINWEGSSIAALPQLTDSSPSLNAPPETFTLDDFSDLF